MWQPEVGSCVQAALVTVTMVAGAGCQGGRVSLGLSVPHTS